VGRDKLPNGESPDTFGTLVPDLVVEVLSPKDSLRFVGEKIGEYFENGVPLVWLVDPGLKRVTIYRSLLETEQLTVDDIISGETILPGFSCPITLFF
jgi:Uma2 family endonuclease